MFETCIKFNNPVSDFVIEEEPENIDGLNFLAGRKMSYINEKARPVSYTHLDVYKRQELR